MVCEMFWNGAPVVSEAPWNDASIENEPPCDDESMICEPSCNDAFMLRDAPCKLTRRERNRTSCNWLARSPISSDCRHNWSKAEKKSGM